MTKYQNSILAMITLLKEWLGVKLSIYVGDKPMENSVKLFNIAVGKALGFLEKQALPISDAAKITAKKKKSVIELGFFISNRLLGYGTFVEKEEIIVATDFRITHFKRLPGAKLINEMRYIVKLGNKYKTELVDYMIAPQMITELGTTIDSYEKLKSLPRTAETNKKASTTDFGTALKDCVKIAKKYIDINIYPYKSINSEFYQQYWLNREIVDIGYNKLAFRVNVCDGETMEPLSLVNVTVAKTKAMHRTSEFGNCHFRTMPTGTYTIRYYLEGYAEYTGKVSVVKGKTKDVFIKLLPVVE